MYLFIFGVSAILWDKAGRPNIYLCLTAIVAAVAAVVAIAAFVKLANVPGERDRLQAITISNVDKMSGMEFEAYVAKLLSRQGYSVETTKASGDLGVDIVAKKDAVSLAIQCKRQTTPVSRRAISDAVAGRAHYVCNAAMVVTNDYFTQGAQELARSNGCQLVNRDTLMEWIVRFR